jgi:acetolactate synthase regulatory subunit
MKTINHVPALNSGTIREGVEYALLHSSAKTMERVFSVLSKRGFDYHGAMNVVTTIGECEAATVEELLYEASNDSEVL